MKVQISKTFDFDAAHFLPTVPADHKCRRMHGHTYRVEVVLEGDVGDDGMVCDYALIARVWAGIEGVVDHRVLNEIPGLAVPTPEVLAPWLLREFRRSLPVQRVRVYESSSTWCEVLSSEVP